MTECQQTELKTDKFSSNKLSKTKSGQETIDKNCEWTYRTTTAGH